LKNTEVLVPILAPAVVYSGISYSSNLCYSTSAVVVRII